MPELRANDVVHTDAGLQQKETSKQRKILKKTSAWTTVCQDWKADGGCPRGDQCTFLHGIVGDESADIATGAAHDEGLFSANIIPF
jgi:hypothetical protein